jgi:very-short-patch-repair endonuclease
MTHYSRDTKIFKSLPYNPKLKKRAQELRRAGNLSEVLLWLQLKQGKLLGLDFDRQKIIGNYIVDFFCAQKSLVIEVDGSSHNEKIEYDTQR